MTDRKINIRQFKMLNGEDIIGLVNQKETKSYIIERPFKIISNMIGGFSLLPWFPFSSQKLFKVSNEFIMHHVEIDEDMKTEYIKLAAGQQLHPKPVIDKHDKREMLLEEFNEFVEGLEEELELDSDLERVKEETRTLH